MRLGYKSKVILTISIILFMLICCGGLYLLSRSIHINNDDLLLTYETLKPVSVSEEKVGNSIYVEYFYVEDIGLVIVEDGGRGVVIRDNKQGFIKDYRYGVLYYVNNLAKEELISEIMSYLNPKFWFGGGREVVQNGGRFLRAIDECQ